MYNHFKQENFIATINKDLFLSHPNDVYLVIKRIAIQWKTVKELLEPNKLHLNKLNLDKYVNRFNFKETIEDYEKIVYFYKSDITSAANGVITYKTSSGEQKAFKSLSNQTFDAFDCYSIGKQSFEKEDYISAQKWLTLALNRIDTNSKQIKSDILDYLSLTEYHSDNYEQAIELMNESVQLLPDRPLIEGLLRNLFIEMTKHSKNEQGLDEDYIEIQNEDEINEDNNVTDQDIISPELTNNSNNLCQARINLNQSIQSKLKCFYLSTTFKPYLRLTRVKVEELFKRPQIVLIHNFLSDTEIDTLIQISKSEMSQMLVVNNEGQSVYDTTRTALGCFLQDDYHPVIDVITRRISEITGIEAWDKSADQLNVIQYKVGGQFVVHYDVDTNPISKIDDRMATWINYFADVEAGGATVFPKLNVTVWPEKGSAVFWYNMLNSVTDRDDNLAHTGCPLLYGNKWIATKWIRVKGQPRGQCSLNRKEIKVLQEVTIEK